MPKQFAKIDANTVQITEQVTPSVVVSTYIYNDLVAQRDALVAQKTAINATIDQQIADINANITGADGLGIVAAVVSAKVATS